ncbi:MAG: copper-translocating P-type ATPase, partial [Elusimicrobia bacterium CG08_land_8_20_14_0_20_51_18]
MKPENGIKHRLKKAIIPIEGIYCSACVSKIESALMKTGGVDSVSVHLAGKTAIVKYDADAVSAEKITAKIKELGYEPLAALESYLQSEEISGLSAQREKSLFLRKFLLAAFFSGVLSYDYFFPLSDYTLFLLTGFVWLYCGWHFHAGFARALRNRSADMNVLVSLSTSAAFFYSSAAVFLPGVFYSHEIHPQWHETAMLIAFINLGKYLEARSKAKAGEAVNALLRVAPKFATLIRENGTRETVKAEEIKKGDKLLVRPGQQAPVDGRVLEGTSFFDESMLTGESAPVSKNAGDTVYAGSINRTGVLTVTAENVGEDMLLMKIARLVRESQAVKINIQHKVDKISAYFVPAVFLVAVTAAAVWFRESGLAMSVNVFATVLAAACPCAMGLSVPMAVMLGFTRASRIGFLINNPNVLENFEKIDTVIFDKTGTLTKGELSLLEIKPAGIKDGEFLKLLLTAELNSEHPFAEAVRKHCFSKNIEPCEILESEAVPGKGFRAKTGEGEILAGTAGFMAGKGVKIPVSVAGELAKEARQVVLLASAGKFRGYAVFGDSLRGGIKEVIAEFRARGIQPVIASGDRRASVEAVAGELGVEDFYYEVLPQEKHSVVLKYKALGKKVMMIGDGINDSAAVNEADIGVSMKSSSDITLSASDIVLMRDDVSLLFKLLDLSVHIKKTIKQNLVWAFLYNIILIPVAAGVFYRATGFIFQPYMAALAMGLSSVSVVLNSLRLL